ncbi:MAG: putative polysaccharide biosynthesis protein [Christensenellaceae bacterium]
MTQAQKNFAYGAAILGAAGLIVKIIGAFYRIPLSNIIGTEGMGYYQLAYPFYSMLVVVSTAGLPSAISKLVAAHIAKGDHVAAHTVFLTARRILLYLGIGLAVIMLFMARPIAALQQTPGALYPLMAISPALFFVAMMSAYRGYFQGMQNMKVTALSQIVEQCGKLAIGLTLAYGLYAWTGRPELGALGALLGISISEAIALVYVVGVYRKKKRSILNLVGPVDTALVKKRFMPVGKQILLIAVPITLSACIMPITGAIDSVIVSRVLQSVGYAQPDVTAMYGVLSGMVVPLINMPSVFALALYTSLIPSISASSAGGNVAEVGKKTALGIKLAVFVGLPATVGFFLLAQPIVMLLYRNITPAELELATGLLRTLSVSVLFLTLGQTMMGILQGMGKPLLPMFSLMAGAGAKVAASIALIRMPDVNIYGAAIGTVVCYVIVAVMDGVFVAKNVRLRADLLNRILKPAIATAAMGAVALLVYGALGGYSNTAGVLAAVAAAAVVYVLLLVVLRGFEKDELPLIPGGGKLEKLMIKMKVWK